MANRYWRGGAGTWDTTTTTNWSTSSGGAGGASVPTAADSVFFDQAGTYTVTCTGALTCLDITVSAGTVTFANGTSPTFAISGSMSLLAGTVWSATGAITFNATTTGKTITTNGVAINTSIAFNGVGGAWTLGSALTCTDNSGISIVNGTFDTSSTGNYSVTSQIIFANQAGTKTINLNASTINLSGNATQWNIISSATLNAGTSTISISSISSSIGFVGGGKTYYNLTYTSSAITSQVITGSNTFNNITIPSRTTVGIAVFNIGGNQTINGTLTLNAGTAAAYRTMLASDTIGTQRTLTCAAISGGTDYDFRDINIAGAASPIAPTRAGDCKGNSGITFPAAKTVYYRATGSANWGATGTGSWSATSGGSLDATMFPLAQDTAIFPAATYPASGSTTTINAAYNIGTIDMSLRTSNTMLLASSTLSPTFYGNWINGTGISISGTATIAFSGRATQTITSAGKSFTQPILINSPSGTVQLQDAFTTTVTNITTLTTGTLDLQSYTLSTGFFSSTNSNTRTIAFGTGNITCTGTGTVWTTATVTNLTTTGTQVVNVTSSGSTAITVSSGALSEANSISYNFTGGTYALTFLGTSNYSARNVDFTGYAGTLGATSTVTVYGNIKFSTGMTLTASTSTLTFGATSGTQQITTNGKTIDFPLTFNGVGGTFQLQDALTMGSTRTASLSGGTLDLNGKTFTAGSNFVVSGTSTRNLTFNGGTVICPGTTSTAFNCTTATNLTTTAGTGVGTISMTGATAKGFNNTSGVNIVFNCTINQGGAGQLTFTGSNTFNNITNTVQPATILFTAGTTTTFTSAFSLSGTAGNLITIGSVTAASHTLSKASGTVSCDYLSISRSTATGGASWYAGANSTDGGNNSGWIFTAPPAPVTSKGNFLVFFN